MRVLLQNQTYCYLNFPLKDSTLVSVCKFEVNFSARLHRTFSELWNADDDLPLADVQLQIVLEQSKKDAEAYDCLEQSTEGSLLTKVY